MVACVVLEVLAIRSVGGHHRDLIAIFGPLIGGAGWAPPLSGRSS